MTGPRRVTVRVGFTCRLEKGDVGRIPRATKDYPAGWSGLMPEHHWRAGVEKGAIDGDAEPRTAVEETGGSPAGRPQADARGDRRQR